ncbi:MAG: hypothetical protein ACI8RZ_007155 [Myxococcota bacterium]|jgi:hypothetical protein
MSQCYTFEVSLLHIHPPIWRTFLLHESATFEDLHRAIQDAFGWMASHLWSFRTEGRGPSSEIAGLVMEGGWGPPTPDASTVPLSAHFTRSQSCLYTYDFGDDWQHHVRLMEMTDAPVWRQLLGGARACPPEDCGGPPGYSQCVAVVAGQEKDPDLKEWLGDWKPEDWALSNEQRVFDWASPPRQQRAVSSPQKPAKKADAKTQIRALLTDPPGDTDELEARLSALHRASARKALAEALESPGITQDQCALLTTGLELVGLGRQQGRLERVVKDAAHPMWLRAQVFWTLVQVDPEAAHKVQVGLSSDDQHALALQGLVQLAETIYTGEGTGALVEMLLNAPGQDAREGLIGQLGFARRHLGLPASGLYLGVWRSPELAALRPLIRPALIGEGTATACVLLADDAPALKEIRSGLRVVASDADDAPALPSRAWLSTCDGQGAFNVFVMVGAELKLMGGVCIQATAEIRDSWVLSGQSDDDGERIMAEFEAHASARFIPVPVPVVAALVVAAMERGQRMGIKLDEVEFRAAALILYQAAASGSLASPKPQKRTIAAYRKLLERGEYGSWFFDEDDLHTAGLKPPPKRKDALKKWKKKAEGALNTPAIRARLEGMTEHMARWHHAAGESESAGLCQAALEWAQGGSGSSALFKVMLERTVVVFHTPEPSDLFAKVLQMMGDLEG